MSSKKRTRYLKKKKSKLKKQSDNVDPFFYSIDENAFQLSTDGRCPRCPNLSENIMILVEPFEDACPNLQALYYVAVVAWNISVCPELKDTMPVPEYFDSDGKEAFADIVDILIERKKVLFPFDERMVTDFSLDDLGDGEGTFSVTSGELA